MKQTTRKKTDVTSCQLPSITAHHAISSHWNNPFDRQKATGLSYRIMCRLRKNTHIRENTTYSSVGSEFSSYWNSDRRMSLTQSDSSSFPTEAPPLRFPDRRQKSETSSGAERRQFGNSYNQLTPDGKELAEAIDSYKLQHRRRYVTTDELLLVLRDLGYSKA